MSLTKEQKTLMLNHVNEVYDMQIKFYQRTDQWTKAFEKTNEKASFNVDYSQK